MNGKKFAWQGVALLPFVDEKRLKKAVKSLFDELTDEESELFFRLLGLSQIMLELRELIFPLDAERRNIRGENQIFVGKHHKGYEFFRELLAEGAIEPIDMIATHFGGISGTVFESEKCVEPGG